MCSYDLFPVKIKDEEEYEQVLVADPQSRGAPECSQDAIAPPLDCSKPYCVQMVYGVCFSIDVPTVEFVKTEHQLFTGDLLTDPGETLSNTKTQCSSPGAEKECYSPKAKRRRGSGSQMGITISSETSVWERQLEMCSNSEVQGLCGDIIITEIHSKFLLFGPQDANPVSAGKMVQDCWAEWIINVTECNEESEGEEVSNVLYECQPQYDQEHAVSEDLYSIDQQRTLGEILSYCQIMYEAIQKLDQKFDQLQAKVMNVSAVDLNPVLFRQKPQLPASNGHPQVRTETSPVSDGSLPMPQLMPVCSPSPPPQGEGKKPPPLSPAPRVPSPPPLLHQQGQQSRPGQATVSAQGTPSTRRATGSLKNTPPAAENTGAKGSRKSPSGAPPNTKTELIGDPRRQVRIPSSVLQKVSNKKNPRNMVRFLLRGLFSVETLTSSNIMGDSVRGLKKLDPNKIAAMREWLSKKFTRYDLRENGRDWRACISIMNSTARYLRFEAKKNKHKQQNEKFKEGPPDKDEREAPALEETAEIDVELESDSEGGSPSISCKSSTSQVHQRALDSSSRLNQKKDKTESEETLEFLGDPSRQVMVPQYALLTARLRTRPELAARFLIKYLFPYDLLVKSNVYGNRERGILALDRNRISALREHLKEQYPWFLLEEDGQDWKACVGAINSTIRKFRHELKKGKMVK